MIKSITPLLVKKVSVKKNSLITKIENRDHH